MEKCLLERGEVGASAYRCRYCLPKALRHNDCLQHIVRWKWVQKKICHTKNNTMAKLTIVVGGVRGRTKRRWCEDSPTMLGYHVHGWVAFSDRV